MGDKRLMVALPVRKTETEIVGVETPFCGKGGDGIYYNLYQRLERDGTLTTIKTGNIESGRWAGDSGMRSLEIRRSEPAEILISLGEECDARLRDAIEKITPTVFEGKLKSVLDDLEKFARVSRRNGRGRRSARC